MADGAPRASFTGEERCPGMTYTDMLALDSRPVPEFLREESWQYLGSEPLSTERYTSAAFMELENRKMWPKIWQFAAREEELPNPGDTVVYENVGRSYLLVRQNDGGVRAFHNVCLHRGRKLRVKSGEAIDFTCPFHGFQWNIDGSLKSVPCQWDFPHLENRDMSLPELKVDRWQGFIMVSENQEIVPFREWVGPALSHYDRWRLDECYTGAWVGRVIPANWKVTAEAFMEAWHSVVTHPQLLGFLGDANTRYDIYGDNMNRAITPSGVLSPHIADRADQHFVIKSLESYAGASGTDRAAAGDAQGRTGGRGGGALSQMDIPFDENDPVMARKIYAEANRRTFSAMSGHDLSGISDAEMVDNFTYNIFPNFAPWGGFMPNIVYRWRPWGDADHCLMEVRLLMRKPEGQPMPKSVPMHLIPEDQPFSSAAEFIGAPLASVFDQDMANLPYVQEGLKASANREVQLGNYQEIRIRQFHQTLDKYLNA